MRRLGSSVCAILILHVLAGCRHKEFPRPPTYPYEDPSFKTAAQPAGLDQDFPQPLGLLPGDTITVRSISNETSEYEGLVIDDEGKVHMPVAGPVAVSGLSPHQAERTLEGVLQKYDRFVRVSVLVTGWGGHYATVIGAVVNEGQKVITPNMRLAELLASAGGPMRIEKDGELSYIADLEGSRLMRNNQPVPISLQTAMTGDPKHNVLVHPGDQLFVPAGLGSRIAVLNANGGGGMVTYRPGIRLSEAIALGGGVNYQSDFTDIRLVRGPLKNPKVYRYDIWELVSQKRGDVQMSPGDVVFITEHWSATMQHTLERMQPILALALAGVNTYLIYQTYKFNQRRFEQ
ncbi:MAG TPA: polysaccharide biosynthesis/export family protein [Polyangiales bacterium]|nr:polysaccharide biosynthesis/export family protein [Polyangiales bacterium]